MRTLWMLLVVIASSPLILLAQVAIRGEKVYTSAGPAIADGVIIIRDGKVQQVGPSSQVKVPRAFDFCRLRL